MVLNDTYSDIIALKVRRGVTWEELRRATNTVYLQNVMDAAHRGNLPQSFVALAEALGADIEIKLVERRLKDALQ